MREILFRGKRIDDGEWVTGYYWSNEAGNHFIRRSKAPDGRFSINDREVDPSTICQFTCITDKNGVKIFEGDIVKDDRFQRVGYIAYLQQSAGLVIVFKKCDSRLGHRARGSEYYHDDSLEIIGNTYDNPELLEAPNGQV